MLPLPDGVQTPVVAWPGGSRVPVVYLHGIQSHPGWYVRSAEALWRAGHPVFQVTRRGSGDGSDRRGHAASADQLLDDVAAALAFAREETGADRCGLLGVSWGGKLAAAYAACRGTDGLARLGMIAPGLVAQVDVSLATKLAIGLSRVFWPTRRFDIPLSDVELFTDAEAGRAYLRDDPRRLKRATASFLVASHALDRRLAKAPAASVSVPTTLLLAQRDRIIDNDRTRALVERLTGGQAAVHVMAACHAMDFEDDPAPFLERLTAVFAQDA